MWRIVQFRTKRLSYTDLQKSKWSFITGLSLISILKRLWFRHGVCICAYFIVFYFSSVEISLRWENGTVYCVRPAEWTTLSWWDPRKAYHTTHEIIRIYYSQPCTGKQSDTQSRGFLWDTGHKFSSKHTQLQCYRTYIRYDRAQFQETLGNCPKYSGN